MPMNVNRWLQYAKAKLDDTLASGHDELDKLEARQEAERADKPWLASEGEAPTFDEARARIAWEAAQAAEPPKHAAVPTGEDTPPAQSPPGTDREKTAADPATTAPAARSLPTDPQTAAEAAERSAAQIVLDQRAEESAARLAAIRAELGVDDPADPPA